jgi:hypothetical protein
MVAHPHAAQTKRRHFQTIFSQFTPLHLKSFFIHTLEGIYHAGKKLSYGVLLQLSQDC